MQLGSPYVYAMALKVIPTLTYGSAWKAVEAMLVVRFPSFR